MKKLTLVLSLAVIALRFAVRAQEVTAILTITNAPAPWNNPTNGATLTLDGTVLTWTNIAAPTSAFIPNTNNVGQELTNLFTAIQLAGISGIDYVAYTGTNTNSLVIVGLALTAVASISPSNWCTIALSSATVSNSWHVDVPSSSYPSATVATNTFNLVATALDLLSSYPISPYNILLSNYFSLTATQTVTGPHTFLGANVYSGGTITNVILQQVGGSLSNVTVVNGVFTNGQNYGNPFRSPGLGTASEQFGVSAQALTNYATAIGDQSLASAQFATVMGATAQATGPGSSAFGTSASASGLGDTAVGDLANASGGLSTALGDGSAAAFTNSTAVGVNATTTAPHQVILGTASEYVLIPGPLSVSGSVSNLLTTGTNKNTGTIENLRTNVTTLANGANNVDCGQRTYLNVSGPTGAFSIAGILNGRDGRILIIQNSTGQTMTIANDSGFSTTGLRIYTGTGADVASTGNPGFAVLVYDTSASHWGLVSLR